MHNQLQKWKVKESALDSFLWNTEWQEFTFCLSLSIALHLAPEGVGVEVMETGSQINCAWPLFWGAYYAWANVPWLANEMWSNPTDECWIKALHTTKGYDANTNLGLAYRRAVVLVCYAAFKYCQNDGIYEMSANERHHNIVIIISLYTKLVNVLLSKILLI